LGQAMLEKVPDVALAFGEAFANIEQIRLIEIGGAGARGEGVEGSVERFLDTLPNTLFNFLQGMSALLGGPIDDLVAAWIVEEAEKRGVEVAPEQQEAIREMVAARVAEVGAEEEEAQPANEDEATVDEEAEAQLGVEEAQEGPAARSAE
ncbi:MAG: hypothetical protein MUP62_00675, partial [Dehalococcoidia bacterium]|nr:hypothetical protein [Dehalococcoidia bacterium]